MYHMTSAHPLYSKLTNFVNRRKLVAIYSHRVTQFLGSRVQAQVHTVTLYCNLKLQMCKADVVGNWSPCVWLTHWSTTASGRFDQQNQQTWLDHGRSLIYTLQRKLSICGLTNVFLHSVADLKCDSYTLSLFIQNSASFHVDPVYTCECFRRHICAHVCT